LGSLTALPQIPYLHLKGPTKRREGELGQGSGEGRVIFLSLSIHGRQKGTGKFLMGVLESPGKVPDFFVSKRVGTLVYVWFGENWSFVQQF